MSDELRSERVTIMMAASELKAVDDWSFAQRIRSRGEAIRRLIQTGLGAPAQQAAPDAMAVGPAATAQIAPQPPAEPRKPRAGAGRARQ
jgi:hypothetical protein